MKEAIHSGYPRLFKRFTFRDEQLVRKEGGEPTNAPTFNNGVCSFVAASSQKITYPAQLGVQSIRLKLKDVTSFYMKLSSTRSIQVSSGFINVTGFTNATIYINGVTSPAVGNDADIVIVDTVNYYCDDIQIGYNGSTYGTFSIDLGQLYVRDLTSSEVSNLYNNTWNTPLPPMDGRGSLPTTLLNYESWNGVAEDSLNSLTLTNITIRKI